MNQIEITTQSFLDQMEDRLAMLAYHWRGADDSTEQASQIASQYQAILRCMVDLGFKAPLDIDSELPDRLMPQEYLALHGRG